MVADPNNKPAPAREPDLDAGLCRVRLQARRRDRR